MDPLSGTIAVLSIGSKLLSMGSGSTDPSPTILFETYRNTQIINERLASIDSSLISIHTAVLDLDTKLNTALDNQTDSEAATELRVAMNEISTAYRAYLADIRDENVPAEVAETRYVTAISNKREFLSNAIGRITDTAPYSLDLAVAGAGFELYIERRLNPGLDSSLVYARTRIAAIRRNMEIDLAAKIEAARTRMDAERASTRRLLALPNWDNANSAFIYGGSYYSYGLQYGSFNCLSLDAETIYEPEGLSFLSIDDLGPIAAIRRGGPTNVVGTVCGAEVTTRSGKLYAEDQEITRIGAPNFDYRSICESVGWFACTSAMNGQPRPDLVLEEAVRRANSPTNSMRTRLQQSPDYTSRAEQRLELANLAAILYSLLVKYRDELNTSLMDFETRLRALERAEESDLLDAAFRAELNDLTSFPQLDLYEEIRGIGEVELMINQSVFVDEVTEAALAADAQIAEGVRRVDSAIQDFNDRPRIHQTLKRLTLALEVFSAVTKIADALSVDSSGSSQVPRVTESAPVAATSAPVETAGQIAEATNSDQTDRVMMQSDYDRAQRLLNELRSLGLPTGNPSRARHTRQEALAEELTSVLSAWPMTEGDQLYAQYTEMTDDMNDNLGRAISDGRATDAAKIVLRYALTPSITSPASDTGSIYHRDRFFLEAKPYIQGIRDWRLGINQN